MRNPDRIGPFCDRLKAIWSTVPDWRFGQLMENVRRIMLKDGGRDIFFAEDEALMQYMEDLFFKGEQP